MNVFLLCVTVLVILYFALSLYVSILRGRYKVGVGTGDDPSGPLGKAIRAHGNAAEYVPIFIALFIYFALSGAGGWIAWVAVGVTLARIFHALGMLWTGTFHAAPHPLRAIGAMGTYVGGFALGVALLLRMLL